MNKTLKNDLFTNDGPVYAAILAFVIVFRILASGKIMPWTVYLENAVLAVLVITAIMQNRRGPSFIGRMVLSGLIIYFGAGLMSVFFSVSPWDSVRQIFFQAGGGLLFLAVVYAGKNRAVLVSAVFLICGFIVSGHALRQYFGGFESALLLEGLSDYAIMTISRGRVFGLTSSPDMLAAMLAGFIPVCLSLIKIGYLNQEARWGRLSFLISGLFLLVFISVIYLTMSIGGILSAFIGTACWLAMTIGPGINKKTNRRFVTGLAAAVIVAALIAGWAIHKRGGVFFDMKHYDNPIVMRLDNWSTGIALYKEFPFTGAGIGQHGVGVLIHKKPESNEAKHAHNTFVEVLSETGPVGFLGLLMVLYGFLFAGREIFTQKNEDDNAGRTTAENLLPGIFCGGIAVFAHSMIDYDWAVPEVMTIFWVSLAVVSVRGKRDSAEDGIWTSKKFKAAAVFVLAVVIIFELYNMEGERRRYQASLAARSGQWIQAYEQSKKALSWDPTSSEMWSLSALAVQRTSPEKDRTQDINKAIKLYPRYPYNYRDLGLALEGKDEKAAGEAFSKSVLLYPNSYNLNLHLGKWYVKQKKYDEAKKVLLHAMRCRKSNFEAALELGRVYLYTDQKNEAEKYFVKAAGARFFKAKTAIMVSNWLRSENYGSISYSFLAAWIKSHPDSNDLDSVKNELYNFHK